MKRIIFVLALMLMASSVMAAGNRFVVPTDGKDNPLQGDGYGGASSKLINDAVDGTEEVVFAGKGVVYGIMLSSGVVSSFVVLSDSGTVTSPTGAVTSQMTFKSTDTVIYTFPQGIRVSDGATLAITGAAGEFATVFYLDEEL